MVTPPAFFPQAEAEYRYPQIYTDTAHTHAYDRHTQTPTRTSRVARAERSSVLRQYPLVISGEENKASALARILRPIRLPLCVLAFFGQ